VWTAYELLIVLLACVPCVEHPRRRHEERYCTTERAILSIAARSCPATLIDLSVSGAAVRASINCRAGDVCQLEIPDVGFVEGHLARRGRDGRLGIRFDLTPAARRRLIHKLFVRPGYVPEVREGSLWAMTKAIFARVCW
jgi:cellulose synthase (UDP-forming)